MKKEKLNYYMKIVLDEAKKALNEGEIPIACLILKDKKILALQHNAVESKNDATAHAEILAIKEASKMLQNWRLTDCMMFVNVEPCTMCMGAIENSRIKTLVYGINEEKTGACGSRYDISLFNPQKIKIIKGIKKDASKDLLEKTFKEKRIKSFL